MIRPKRSARLGEFRLEEAILDMLLKARHEGQRIGAAEIGKRTGIFRQPGDPTKGEPASMNDAVATGMLIKPMMPAKRQRQGRSGTDGQGVRPVQLLLADGDDWTDYIPTRQRPLAPGGRQV